MTISELADASMGHVWPAHRTMYRLPPTPPAIDAIIIAGDVTDGHEGSAVWLSEHAVPRGLPVLYIAGNQDFFGHDLLGAFVEPDEAAGVTLLHAGRPTTTIAGCRFVGVTLWTDYRVAGDEGFARAWARLNTPDMEEILATKLRALLQRDKGRDLFDLKQAAELLPHLDHDQVIETFQKYLVVSRANAGHSVLAKLERGTALDDLRPLVPLTMARKEAPGDWGFRLL